MLQPGVKLATVAHTVPGVALAAGAVGEAEEAARAPRPAPLLPAAPGLSAMFPASPWCQRPSATTSSYRAATDSTRFIVSLLNSSRKNAPDFLLVALCSFSFLYYNCLTPKRIVSTPHTTSHLLTSLFNTGCIMPSFFREFLKTSVRGTSPTYPPPPHGPWAQGPTPGGRTGTGTAPPATSSPAPPCGPATLKMVEGRRRAGRRAQDGASPRPFPALPAVTSGGRGRPSHGNCATVETPPPRGLLAPCRHPGHNNGQPPPGPRRRRQPPGTRRRAGQWLSPPAPGREVRGARRGGRALRGGLSAPPPLRCAAPAAGGRYRPRQPQPAPAGTRRPGAGGGGAPQRGAGRQAALPPLVRRALRRDGLPRLQPLKG